jgi:hypothetical protein
MNSTERARIWRLNNLERYRFLQRIYARKRLEKKRIMEGRGSGMVYNKSITGEFKYVIS